MRERQRGREREGKKEREKKQKDKALLSCLVVQAGLELWTLLPPPQDYRCVLSHLAQIPLVFQLLLLRIFLNNL